MSISRASHRHRRRSATYRTRAVHEIRPLLEPLEQRLLLTIGAANVLVIYNLDWIGDQDANGVQDSLQVAQYYAQAHGVPAQNLVGVHGGATPLNSGWDAGKTTPYTTFYNNMVTPVTTALNTIGKTNISVLLFCYGINDFAPTADTNATGISLDDAMVAPFLLTPTSGIAERTNPYFDAAPGFDALKAHFSHSFTVNGSTMYLVSRLDGPRGLWDALEQIDQAAYAQKYLYPTAGYFNGTVYIDDQDRDQAGGYTDAWLQASSNVQTGSYANYGPADENMAQTEHYMLTSTLPWKWQDTGKLIGDPGTTFKDGTSAETAPNALFFGGWYGWNYGMWGWLPGSIADNLISESMVGLEGHGVVTETVKQLGLGLTAGVGTVAEPYVDGHPRPNIMIYYLLKGYSFAEAAMLCTPYLGWMGINVGDPLYTPLDPNKAAVKDTTTPTPASSFNPAGGWWDASGNYHVGLSISQSNGPEVASATIQYGLTTAYGSSASCTAFYERPDLILPDAVPGKTYYAQITLTNAVGGTASYNYTFVMPAKTIYQDTFPFGGSFRYRTPILVSANDPLVYSFTTNQRRWDSGGGGGTAVGGGAMTPGVNLSGNTYYFLPVSTSILQSTAGTYTFTVQLNSTGAADQYLALGFGRGTAGSSTLASANAIVTLCGPATSGGTVGGLASTYYGTGTGATGHAATGAVHGNGNDTITITLVTDGQGGASVSFSDSAGLLPSNSGGNLAAAELANIGGVFIASSGTATGTVGNVSLAYTTLRSGNAAGDSTTTLTTSSNTIIRGQPVTFTATVTPQQGSGTPSGVVFFKEGGTGGVILGTATLDANGVGTFTTSAFAGGDHFITVVYGGNAAYDSSASGTIIQHVLANVTTATLSSSANPSTLNQSVTLSVSVTSGNGIPNGSVSFMNGTAVLGTVTLDANGNATYSTSTLAVGARFITVVYAGNNNYMGGTSNLIIQSVNAAGAASTTTTLSSSSANPSMPGQSVTFTATVASGANKPTGSATFLDGSTILGTATLNGNGVASFTTSTLAAGAHAIIAVYNGNATYNASVSNTITQNVNVPEITGVFLSSTAWSQAFLNSLASGNLGDATYGYKIPTGASQLLALPWSGLNQISIVFNESVNVSQSSLAVAGLNLPTYSFNNFNYNNTTHTATWTLAASITTDKLQLSIPAASVSDTSNNPLDGEWTDSVSAHSGDGTAGGNFVFHFNVLPGDVNQSGTVDLTDLTMLAGNWQQPPTSPLIDLNGDTHIDLTDLTILAGQWQTSLPAGSFGAAAGSLPLLTTKIAATPSSPAISVAGPALTSTITPTAAKGISPSLPASPFTMDASLVRRRWSFTHVSAPPRHQLLLLDPTAIAL